MNVSDKSNFRMFFVGHSSFIVLTRNTLILQDRFFQIAIFLSATYTVEHTASLRWANS